MRNSWKLYLPDDLLAPWNTRKVCTLINHDFTFHKELLNFIWAVSVFVLKLRVSVVVALLYLLTLQERDQSRETLCNEFRASCQIIIPHGMAKGDFKISWTNLQRSLYDQSTTSLVVHSKNKSPSSNTCPCETLESMLSQKVSFSFPWLNQPTFTHWWHSPRHVDCWDKLESTRERLWCELQHCTSRISAPSLLTRPGTLCNNFPVYALQARRPLERGATNHLPLIWAWELM